MPSTVSRKTFQELPFREDARAKLDLSGDPPGEDVSGVKGTLG
jgi:hypothetical protein